MTSARRRLVTVTSLLVLIATSPAWAGTTASHELGQPDFVHNSANNIRAQVLNVVSTNAGVAVDTSSSPNHLYIADTNNNRVLGYKSIAALTNGAPADLVIGERDLFSAVGDGNGVSRTSLSGPGGVAVDGNGNLYVADTSNNRVLVFSNPFTILNNTGQNSGFAASAVIGQAGDFTSDACNVGGSAPSADTLCSPQGVALDAANNLYITDTSNNRVLEYNGPVTSGTLSASRVFGQFGSFVSNTANNGGISKDSLANPTGVAVDNNGNLYVADSSNSRVLEYNTPLAATAVTGSGDTSADQVWGQGGSFGTGSCDGSGLSATSLCAPSKIALDGSANLYIADTSNNRVLEFNEGANPPTNRSANLIFGQSSATSNACNQGGTPSASTLCIPASAAVDSSGDVFVLDADNNRVLMFNTPLSTDTVADLVLGQPNFVHNSSNFAEASSLDGPQQIAIDASASPNRIFVADTVNNRILGYINPASFSNGAPADLVIGQSDFVSSSGGITATTLSNPAGVAVDASGNLYVADTNNSRVLEYTTPFSNCSNTFPCVGGAANKVFGQPNFTTAGCNSSASVTSATLCVPQQVYLDSQGNLYVADSGNNRVLEYNTPLNVTSVTGSGDTTADLVFGQGVNGIGTEFTTNDCNHPSSTTSANSLCGPIGIAVDPSNNLYVGDASNSRVLEYNETVSASQPPGNVTANQVFGQLGSFSQRGCDNGGLNANSLCFPTGVASDSSGNIYVADHSTARVLEYFTPLSTDTTADVVWGQGGDLATGSCNLGGPAPSAATLCNPSSVATDGGGNVYISDSSNNRVTGYSPPFPPPGALVAATSSDSLSLRPTQIKFQKTRVGKYRNQDVRLTNSGSVPAPVVISMSSPDFAYTSSCGSVVPANQSCTIRVTFAPITTGLRGGSLLVRNLSGNGPHIVGLSGRGKRRRMSR